jgi:hypothetical protein
MGPGNSKEGIRIVDGGIKRGLFRKDRERLAVKLTQSKYKKLKSASPKGGG